MAAKIRALHKDDRAIWEQMFQSYAEFYKTSVPEGGFDAVWGWIFDDQNDFWCAVAEAADGQVVGFTQYQLMHPLPRRRHDLLSQRPLRTRPRNSEAPAQAAPSSTTSAPSQKSEGLPGVRWLTQEFNYPARRLYDTYAAKTDFILYSVSG